MFINHFIKCFHCCKTIDLSLGNFHKRLFFYDSVLSSFTPYSAASPTPDDDVFKHLATVYSFNHLTMHLGHPCPDGSSTGFANGTTNGAQWYPLTGV
jgi:hypothetical protein